ncbi:MAG: hypothetical protein JSW03_07985 [Candidatus Eiseniibacteriota bacterium]|nr:MAG: hypothetical protein JSW03_07985 [Candidatus Eisenbacteria bacterium]
MNANLSARALSSLVRPVAVVLIATALSGLGCKPVLDDLDPREGPPGTVVEIKGGNLLLATVRWNANTPSEQTLPSDFLGARFFTVPSEAEPGQYPVQLHGDGEYSDNKIDFEVTDGVVRPVPRLDDVTVVAFDIDPGGKASMVLMAHGANIDVGAQIIIDGTAVMSFFSRLLRNGAMNASDPSTLGYPIFHYATTWTFIQNQVPDSDISVAVKNLDGATSNTLTYHIAASMDELDSDGDGLLDVWEKDGYDSDGDGGVDVDLPALGAEPWRKDLFVEVDWMEDCEPDGSIWADIEATFEKAPILNADGSQGIAIHLDVGDSPGDEGGETIGFSCAIREDDEPPDFDSSADCVNFQRLKDEHFNKHRLKVYRYCIFAYQSGYGTGKSSGKAEGLVANDFFISLHSWGSEGRIPEFQVGTFLHELGHTLGLRHGGSDDVLSKDNYNSIMQYGNDASETYYISSWPPCSPGQLGGIDADCDLSNIDNVFTYSQGQRRELNERELDESEGMCDKTPVDWDMDEEIETSVRVNLDADADKTVIQDFPDWANIELNFRVAGSEWNEN